jgi:uncharacterized membrane protein
MRFLFAVIFLIGSIYLSYEFRHEIEIVVIGIATVLGFALGKVYDLQRDLRVLRETMARDWQQRNAIESAVAVSEKTSVVADKSEAQAAVAESLQIETSVAKTESSVLDSTAATFGDAPKKPSETSYAQVADVSSPVEDSFYTKEPLPIEDTIADKVVDKVKSYFTGGNLFVRIGIIILFFGVSFLLKYVSDQGLFPIEYRLIGVVVGAIALLGLGWRLRHKNETYALLLQGAGIGVLYLDIYAAFSMYGLLPATAAFALLFVVSMFSAALAVLQDSKSLAVLGFSGGFIAPVLASSGSNNYIGLFSYYVILNLAITAVAWFKAWRPLNLLGFVFTFIIGTAWGVTSYKSENFSTTEPFLIVFFLLYVLIAVLFALRQPPKLRGYVDGTLLFGVPLAASGLQYALVKDFEYGVSLSSFAMGAFYLVLSWFIWKRKGDGLKLLAEAFLALGVIFASMAIPFALAPTQTAAAWALEGAGLLWLGSRQNRLSVRFFGLLLQFGAGIAFLSKFDDYFNGYNVTAVSENLQSYKPFLNGEFLSSMMLSIAGIITARLLIKPYEGRRSWEKGISPAALIWGLLWLFGGFIYQLLRQDQWEFIPTNMLIFTAVTSLIFTVISMRLKPEWKHAWIVASGLFGLVLILGFVDFGLSKYNSAYHPLQHNGWIAWPLVFVVYYFLLKQLEKYQVLERFQPVLHSLLLLLLVVLITVEGAWQFKTSISSASDWMGIWYIVPTIIAMWLIIKAKFWPFSIHKHSYRQQTGVALAAVMSIWSFIALGSKGTADPLPWIPLLNPLDVVSIIVFITLFKWWQSISDNFALIKNQNEQNKSFNQRAFSIAIAGLVFLWLNFTLFRVAYHWFDVSYNAEALYNSNLVQSAVSILWALSGVILTVFASRKNIRFLWVAGAFILGLVVLKLFVIDFSTLGSLARIISFLVVGILLTSIGYFAPLPDKESDKKHDEESVVTDEENTEQKDENNA